MAPHGPDDRSREQRLMAMLHAISRSLSGAASVHEAITEVADAAHAVLAFERIAVHCAEGEDALRVRAASAGVPWAEMEGRLIRREDCSPRLWIALHETDRIGDVTRVLDPSFPLDREIIERGTRSVLRVPLEGRAGSFGMLSFAHRRVDAFDEHDERTAAAIAGLISMALEHERLLVEEVRRRSRLAALDAALPQIGELRDLDEIAVTLSRLAQGIVDHDALAVVVLHAGGARAHAVADSGLRTSVDVAGEFLETQMRGLMPAGHVLIRDTVVLDESRRLVRQHFARGDERFHHDVVADEGAFRQRAALGARSELRVAVRRGDELLGIIIFVSRTPDRYGEEDAGIAKRFAERLSLRLAVAGIEAETRRASEASARAQALEERVVALQRELEAARGPHAVVGASRHWREVLAQATRVAGTDTTVLLTGESGTGKEVVARFIHHASKRAAGPFVAINCAALPEQLLEAELFGHEKGAFTGAAAARSGRLEQAAGGVLFLDEVGEMSPSVQAKFLRVLQEREFQRLGSARVLKADVRVVAATNRDLAAAIERGEFREDLYYRLHVFAIHLPPLRERPDDVLALAEHFLKELGATLGHAGAGMTAEARDALVEYRWPGNARELRNVIERALILSDGELVGPAHLAFAPGARRATVAGAGDRATAGTPPAASAAPAEATFDLRADGPLPAGGVDLEALERSLVQRAMSQAAGNKSQAARLLGLSRAQLYTRLEKYGL